MCFNILICAYICNIVLILLKVGKAYLKKVRKLRSLMRMEMSEDEGHTHVTYMDLNGIDMHKTIHQRDLVL